MISGFNTDVRHNEVTFHVQTEDKGTSNPFVESLVYVGGQVLAAKRSSYAKFIEEGKGAKAISDLMEAQHRAVINAIRQGKFDTKVESLLAGRPPTRSVPILPPEEDVLSSTKVAEAERTLDQVILEYLTSEAEQEQLRLVVDGEPSLNLGSASRVNLKATSSRSGDPVTGAQVDVKLISTVAETRTLAAGETDVQGGVELSFTIPDLGDGAAALIFTAESAIGTAELKHLL